MNSDTIAAVSTPVGEGAIGIVRLSGRDAVSIADKLFYSPRGKRLKDSGSHRLIHGFIKDPATSAEIDEVLASVMRAPDTYTREDVVEINCHGGIQSLRRALEVVLISGARLAEPGEFTKRAYLNGRLDLSQAEAVMDVIRARTDKAKEVALKQLSGGLSEEIATIRDRAASLCANIEAHIDFPEEDIGPANHHRILLEIKELRERLIGLSNSFEEGRFFRDGLKAAIVGRPNAGKSSLLNALLKRDRAIVTELPGTTRDVIEEYLSIKGLPVRIIDTAGIRETHDLTEKEGVARSLRAIDEADLIIGLIDGSKALHEEDFNVLNRLRSHKAIIAVNKIDLLPREETDERLKDYSDAIVGISAKTGKGLDALKDKMLEASMDNCRDGQFGIQKTAGENSGVIVTNIRHKAAIDRAIKALNRASEAADGRMPPEITAVEMRDALDRLGEIVGAVTTEDILDRIFSEFCIGK